jgi:hypothetical protein
MLVRSCNSASRATPCTRSDAAEATGFVWACSVWLTATNCISRRAPWLAASMAACAKAVSAPFASRGTAGFRSGLDRFRGLLTTLPSEAPDTASDATMRFWMLGLSDPGHAGSHGSPTLDISSSCAPPYLTIAPICCAGPLWTNAMVVVIILRVLFIA